MARLSDIAKVLRELISGLQSQETMNAVAAIAKRRIRERTQVAGVDVHGRPFKPYSDKWAEKREERGLPTHIVDLTFDDLDGMMRQIDHVVAADFESVELDILQPEKRRIAAYHTALGVGKPGENIREFWAINEEDEDDIVALVQMTATDILKDITRDLQ